MAKLTAAIDTLEANIEELTASNETWEAGISSLHDRMGAADEMIDMSAKDGLEKEAANLESQLTSTSQQKDDWLLRSLPQTRN